MKILRCDHTDQIPELCTAAVSERTAQPAAVQPEVPAESGLPVLQVRVQEQVGLPEAGFRSSCKMQDYHPSVVDSSGIFS